MRKTKRAKQREQQKKCSKTRMSCLAQQTHTEPMCMHESERERDSAKEQRDVPFFTDETVFSPRLWNAEKWRESENKHANTQTHSSNMVRLSQNANVMMCI